MPSDRQNKVNHFVNTVTDKQRTRPHTKKCREPKQGPWIARMNVDQGRRMKYVVSNVSSMLPRDSKSKRAKKYIPRDPSLWHASPWGGLQGSWSSHSCTLIPGKRNFILGHVLNNQSIQVSSFQVLDANKAGGRYPPPSHSHPLVRITCHRRQPIRTYRSFP